MRTCFIFLLVLLGVPAVAAPENSPAGERAFAVTVFCGASRETAEPYRQAASDLGAAIGGHGWTLVYGGGRTGSMGAVATGAKSAGGRIESVLPRILERPSVVFPGVEETVVVETMGQRKAELQTRADVLVVLPGGFGTLDEFADTLELARFGLLDKPIYLLNQAGYFDRLLTFFEHVKNAGFASDDGRPHLTVVTTVDELVKRLEQVSREWEASVEARARPSAAN